MDDFVLILGIFLVVLITILVFNKEGFSLCDGENPKKGFFARFLAYLDSLFFPKKVKKTKPVLDDSFTVPVDERNELMHNSKNGQKYYWSW
jgi:hypothetical protein